MKRKLSQNSFDFMNAITNYEYLINFLTLKFPQKNSGLFIKVTSILKY